MQTNESTYYKIGLIKNIAFFIIFWCIYFYNLFKYHPNISEWTPLILIDYLGVPASIIFFGYLFLFGLRASGCLAAIILPTIILFLSATLIDAVIEKLGLPPNTWPYAFSILGFILHIFNIVKLISNIKWYRIFRYCELNENNSSESQKIPE